MFYSQFILAKKGPLATIWIAAHLERKLRKNQITDTNIGESVDSILYPEVPIALRLSGHLLLGVVRIYSRKVNLLFNDCSEALVKIHQAFQSSAVDLPPGAVVAPFNSITLPESFDFYDLEAHLSRENVAARVGNRSEFEHHVTARDLITLQEQNNDRRSLFTLDERFEDAGNPYAVLDFSIEELAPQKPISPNARSNAENISLEDDVLPPMPMEDDMDFEGMNIDKDPRTANENEPQIETVVEGPSPFPELEVPDIEKLRAVNKAGEQEHLMDLEEPSVSMDVDDRVPSIKKSGDVQSTRVLEETPLLREEPTPFGPERPSPARSHVAFSEDHDILGSILGKRTPKLDVMPTPVSIKRSGKKRKHAFDAVVSLSSVEMKKQLKSTNDICRARRKAPSTEYEIWMSKRDNHIEQSFSEPSFPGLSYDLKSIYDGVISKKFVSPRKQHTVDQVSTRKTPRAVGRLDQEEGVDDVRTIVHPEPFAEETQNETVALAGPSTADNSITKVVDGNVLAGHREEPLSPDPDISFDPVLAMDDGGAIDITREQDGVSTMERLEETTAGDIRKSENEAAANVHGLEVDDQVDGSEGTKLQGLAFLADSRDTDDPANEIAANKPTGKSSSSDSGWSSRSRAVALYLKEKFETLDTGKQSDKNQNRSLNLERLLTGRTQKEAARLFFETLVHLYPGEAGLLLCLLFTFALLYRSWELRVICKSSKQVLTLIFISWPPEDC